MIFRPLAITMAALALAGATPIHAHHGPPHDEIDEFDAPPARLEVRAPLISISWPALAVSLTGVMVAYLASRRWGAAGDVSAAQLPRR
jgi:hypothetical protein